MNKLYVPSNGTEGEWFFEQFCYKCQKDATGRGGYRQCTIMTGALVGKQPKQWVYIDGNPTCTSFKDIKDRRRYVAKPKGQLDIFESKEAK